MWKKAFGRKEDGTSLSTANLCIKGITHISLDFWVMQ
jgi:hypothetical protein